MVRPPGIHQVNLAPSRGASADVSTDGGDGPAADDSGVVALRTPFTAATPMLPSQRLTQLVAEERFHRGSPQPVASPSRDSTTTAATFTMENVRQSVALRRLSLGKASVPPTPLARRKSIAATCSVDDVPPVVPGLASAALNHRHKHVKLVDVVRSRHEAQRKAQVSLRKLRSLTIRNRDSNTGWGLPRRRSAAALLRAVRCSSTTVCVVSRRQTPSATASSALLTAVRVVPAAAATVAVVAVATQRSTGLTTRCCCCTSSCTAARWATARCRSASSCLRIGGNESWRR